MSGKGGKGGGDATNEQVEFRYMRMDCCGHLLCWINPRLPTYCPECGTCVYPRVRGMVIRSANVTLRIPATKI